MRVPVSPLTPVYCLFLVLLLTATTDLSLGLMFKTLAGQRSSPTMMKLVMNQRLHVWPYSTFIVHSPILKESLAA